MKARLIMGSATFFDAFDALSLAFVLPVLKGLWQLTPAQIGFLISASYVGQFFGALLFGALAEKFGRIRSATLAIGVMSIMAIVCVFAGSFEALLLCRFIQGIGVGGRCRWLRPTSTNSRPRNRAGRFFMLYEMIFPIGLMVTGQIGAWVVPAYGWQTMFLIGGVPGLMIALFVAFLPESPRWLILNGRMAEAERIVTDIENSTTAAR
jgi:putative MFS transporter